MIIDCDECVMQGTSACSDCIVTVLIGQAPAQVELDDAEREAIQHLAEAGMVAPLRLVRRSPDGEAAAG